MRWYGHYGQLVLAPLFPSGGEWGGHLILYLTAGRISYAITLHAWLPDLLLTQDNSKAPSASNQAKPFLT